MSFTTSILPAITSYASTTANLPTQVLRGYYDIGTTSRESPVSVPTSGFEDIPNQRPHQTTNTGILAMVFSGLSIVPSVFALYWFSRMRRRFRHDLIMILVISNAFKVFWYFLFPLVEYFVHGLVKTESVFCQISGFCVSLGTEGADVAILLIALHSALSVWTKNKYHVQSGLYPYRYWAFSFWVVFPVLIAAIAFTKPGYGGYTAQGSICYLPSRPATFINLTWIPRYLVFITIVVVYLGIYFWAKAKSRKYEKEIFGLRRTQTIVRERRGEWFQSLFWKPRDGRRRKLEQEDNLVTATKMRNFSRELRSNIGSRLGREPSFSPYSSRSKAAPESTLVLEATHARVHDSELPGGGFVLPEQDIEDLRKDPKTDDFVLEQGTQTNATHTQSAPAAANNFVNPSTEAPTLQEDLHSRDDLPQHKVWDRSQEPLRRVQTMADSSHRKPDAPIIAGDFAGGPAGLLPSEPQHEEEERHHHLWSTPNLSLRRPQSVALPSHWRSRTLSVVKRADPSSLPGTDTGMERSHTRRDPVTDSERSISSIRIISSNASIVLNQTDTVNDVPHMVEKNVFMAQHEQMRRQLRYLFVYPAVYLILWICPFVSMIVKNHTGYYADPSWVLNVFVRITVSIQAGVDCLLFSIIEKPWHHIPGSDGSFWGSFKLREINRRRKKGEGRDPDNVRERLTKQLGNLELQETLNMRSEQNRLKGKKRTSREGEERYWWEQYEDDEDGALQCRHRVSFLDEEPERGRTRRRVSYPVDSKSSSRERERMSTESDMGRCRSESFPSTSHKRSKHSRSSSFGILADAQWLKELDSIGGGSAQDERRNSRKSTEEQIEHRDHENHKKNRREGKEGQNSGESSFVIGSESDAVDHC